MYRARAKNKLPGERLGTIDIASPASQPNSPEFSEGV